MGLFRRTRRPAGGAEPPKSPAPDFASRALGEISRGSLFRASTLTGGRAGAFAVGLEGDEAELLWERLVAADHDGWWPILVGDGLAEQRLAEAAPFADPIESIASEAASIGVPELLERWRLESLPDPSDGSDYIGEWPSSSVAPHGLYVPRDLRTLEPQPTVIAIVAAQDQSLVPAVVGSVAGTLAPVLLST